MPVNTKYCFTRTVQIALCKEAEKAGDLFHIYGVVFFWRHAIHA